MRKLQIGIMGSAADLNYDEEAENFVRKLGELIAKSENIQNEDNLRNQKGGKEQLQ